jgi:hypothetical protein
MAKTSGLGDNLLVDGYDLSGDTQDLKTVRGGITTLDVTGIDKSAYERVGGVRDGQIQWTSHFNPTAGATAHAVLSTLPTTDRQVTYLRGTVLGNAAASCNGKQLNYDLTRGTDGKVNLDLDVQANAYGLEWGTQLTAGLRTDTSATTPGTGVDLTTVSTAFGWQAYLHVTAITGTSVTVTLMDSDDNSSFTNLTGGAFTAATAVGAQRLQGGRTATVRQYVKAKTTGTFTVATFAVVFVRNDAAVAF